MLGSKEFEMIHSTITSKGQTTLPVQVRNALQLKAGDKIVYEIQGKTVVIRPHPGIMALFGALKPEKDQPKIPFSEVRTKARDQWVSQAAKEGLR